MKTDYNFTPNAPKHIDEKRYRLLVQQEYLNLLENHSSDEQAFQLFFERNPCMIPGSRGVEPDLFGSGHGPINNCVITQPKISGVIRRHPDFMWLVNDSSVFSPVLIELEAPNKKMFNKDGTPTSEFTKAKHQLTEWRTILSNPVNVLSFYNDYDIAQEYRDLYFEPWYVIVYGRRSEFENDKNLIAKRALMTDRASREVAMSFDRLAYVSNADSDAVTCTVKDGKYTAKNISPLLTLGPFSDSLDRIIFPASAFDNMLHTSEERKAFLKEKMPYCQQYLAKESGGNTGFSFTFDDLDLQTEE